MLVDDPAAASPASREFSCLLLFFYSEAPGPGSIVDPPAPPGSSTLMCAFRRVDFSVCFIASVATFTDQVSLTSLCYCSFSCKRSRLLEPLSRLLINCSFVSVVDFRIAFSMVVIVFLFVDILLLFFSILLISTSGTTCIFDRGLSMR